MTATRCCAIDTRPFGADPGLSVGVDALFMAVDGLSKAIHQLFKAVHGLFEAVHGSSEAVHELSMGVHELSKAVHELSMDGHERLIDGLELSIDGDRFPIVTLRPLFGTRAWPGTPHNRLAFAADARMIAADVTTIDAEPSADALDTPPGTGPKAKAARQIHRRGTERTEARQEQSRMKAEG